MTLAYVKPALTHDSKIITYLHYYAIKTLNIDPP